MVNLLPLVCLLLASPPVPAGSGVHLYGTVSDSLSGAPVVQASVSLSGGAGADLTDSEGRYRLVAAAGRWEIRIRHTAYEPAARAVVIPPGTDTLAFHIRLAPRIYRTMELTVQAERVVPLTAGEETRYTTPGNVLQAWGLDEPVEILARMPGVVLLGGRAFFRGAGYEHVLPTLDGVPTREPLRGEWITPPPDALLLAQYAPGSFDAEHGQALAGVFSIELPEGSSRHTVRLGLETDRLLGGWQDSRTTDLVRATASGPLPGRGLHYALSWQGRLADGVVRYDHARPGHRFLGRPLGDRMAGDMNGLVRIAWAAAGGGRTHSLTYLGSEVRAKTYHHHYSRRGWVGYDSDYDRYTTFVDPFTTSDSVVFYDAPAHVPTRSRESRLLQQATTLRLGRSSRLRLSLRGAEHRYHNRPEGPALTTESEVIDWVRRETTRLNHQEEDFYATHGDYPEYEEGASRELAGALSLHSRLGGHEISAGAGATSGRHRFLAARPVLTWTPFGSLTRWMRTLDAFGYVQDTWWSDVHSSMTLALRWDAQEISDYPGRARFSSLSPRIGFRQPFSDRDAIHVQYGVLYQFPPLIEHFFRQLTLDPSGLEPHVQASRAFEAGIQHHLSEKAVVYIAAYAREYSDLVISARSADEEDALFPSAAPRPPVLSAESRGLELLLDHQFHRALTGQLRVELGDQTSEGFDLPWSRDAAISGWLTARPHRAVSLSLFGRWDSGQPYAVCLDARGCRPDEYYRGTLPDLYSFDLTTRWSPPRLRDRARVLLEVRNLTDRKVASFDFGLYSSRVGVRNFIAYYDRYGRPGGYLVDIGSQVTAEHIRNPQVWSEGRSLRLGCEFQW